MAVEVEAPWKNLKYSAVFVVTYERVEFADSEKLTGSARPAIADSTQMGLALAIATISTASSLSSELNLPWFVKWAHIRCSSKSFALAYY